MREVFGMIGVTLLCMAALTGVIVVVYLATGWTAGSTSPAQENSPYCQQTGGC